MVSKKAQTKEDALWLAAQIYNTRAFTAFMSDACSNGFYMSLFNISQLQIISINKFTYNLIYVKKVCLSLVNRFMFAVGIIGLDLNGPSLKYFNIQLRQNYFAPIYQ